MFNEFVIWTLDPALAPDWTRAITWPGYLWLVDLGLTPATVRHGTGRKQGPGENQVSWSSRASIFIKIHKKLSKRRPKLENWKYGSSCSVPSANTMKSFFTSFRSINPLSGLVIPAQVILELNSHCDTHKHRQHKTANESSEPVKCYSYIHTHTGCSKRIVRCFFLQYLQKEKG